MGEDNARKPDIRISIEVVSDSGDEAPRKHRWHVPTAVWLVLFLLCMAALFSGAFLDSIFLMGAGLYGGFVTGLPLAWRFWGWVSRCNWWPRLPF